MATPVTGDFDGYGWGENVGWIHFQNASPAYKVQATSTGNLTTGYANDIAALITTRRPGPASSSGLTIGDTSFLNDSGDCIVFGHDNGTGTTDTYLTDIIGTVKHRWVREWQLDKNDGSGTTGGNVNLTFDFGDVGMGTPGGSAYTLLKRSGESGDFTGVATTSNISGDQVIFNNVDVSNLGSNFTLGEGTPTASL